MEQLAVAKDVGLDGAKTSQNRGGLQGVIDYVTAKVAKAVPHLPRSLQVKLAAIGLVGLGVLTEAQGQVVLSDFSPLQNGAISQRSTLQSVLPNGTIRFWNIHGNFFSVSGVPHELNTFKTRGNFLRGPDEDITYFSPFDDEIRHLAILIYQVGNDGKPTAAGSPFIALTRGPNDITVTATGISDSQGFAFHELGMNLSGTVLNPGNYFIVAASEAGAMGGGSGRPSWRVGLTESGSSYVPNLISQDFTNNGEWQTFSRNGVNYTGKAYLDAYPVPEPSGLTVLGFGLALLIKRRRN